MIQYAGTKGGQRKKNVAQIRVFVLGGGVPTDSKVSRHFFCASQLPKGGGSEGIQKF